ncbi:TIGR04222 domain-containing membrane protein [Nonomuraea sp. K274]|uniref:TIGR04222 domain-containing membrane protein n=1 Tax=Nonomuraea cypriaca TaxID=1187855 RepID=A0A931A8U8_9ACTN|nr:TIGR04222 domain-containing membrane protein [Nonomuraea cypriaca]MBF8185579.1 TIGR04222 domain-containing membrane protein [Nonomuraea cypriaca]
MDLILLIVSIVLAVLVVVTVRSLRRELAAAAAAVAGFEPRELTPYELAYLDGGKRSAAITAIAVLAEAGMVRMTREGRMYPVRSEVKPRDSLERQVLSFVSGYRSGLTGEELRKEMEGTPHMFSLDRRLIEIGMLRPRDAFARADRRLDILSVLTWTAVTGMVGVVWTALVMRVTLLSAFAVCVLAMVILAARIAIRWYEPRTWPRRLTPAGQASLEAAKRDNPRYAAEGPAAIALYGPVDRALADEMSGARRRNRWGGGGYGGGGCGGGSASCGGGGCGGGCGGGGG